VSSTDNVGMDGDGGVVEEADDGERTMRIGLASWICFNTWRSLIG